MATRITRNGNEVIISFAGRLDTGTSAEVGAEINNALSRLTEADGETPFTQVTMDASQMEYISSSGLRILLSLSKRYKSFRVIDVQPQVYDVLDTTGFTKILTVERSMRRMIIDGCQLIGVGGVGTVYRLNGDTIIKVFREGTTLDEVRREITMSKEAFVLGMPTAISFDIVKVKRPTPGQETSETDCYGLVYELLNAETLSSIVKQHPEQLEQYALKYADLLRQMHDIEVPLGGNVPSAKERELEQVNHIRRYFPQESVDMMLRIVESIPEANRLLHLDLQTKNVMVQDGELMLIDMGEMGYGHPMLDMGHAYSAMVTLVGDYDKIIGMPRELGQRVWDIAIDRYFEGLPADIVAQRKAQVEVVSCVRNFSWLSLSDSFPEDVVRECQSLFNERVANRFDYIMEVCSGFSKWK
ncbi:MAG: phosphotransferase [Bacteroidaceae bacterium]|nr:phosphotransferase [Bacteroidaceae bacterium]